MEESMRSKTHVKDRLSELPDSLIFHILWFVPMRDVVRTTILSKRWRNRWTTIPFLNFDINSMMYYDINRLQKFVNRALLRWNGIRILKYKVFDWWNEFDDVDTELWVNFAMGKGVEELYLHKSVDGVYYFEGGRDDIYWVPNCLYSCSSLKVLSFNGCFFRINGNVQWNQLKSLTITECFEVTQHMINQILSGSPRLQVLNLSFVDGDGGENLNIRSNSLKELLICKCLFHRKHISLVSELTVWTPNLETMKIEGIPYANCRFINISSLLHVAIGFYGLIYGEGDKCYYFDGIELKNGFLSFQDYIGDKFRQTLQISQNVESVTLFNCCLKVLRAMKMRCMHSPFPNVKSLEIGSCCDNFKQLVGLLGIFPQLEKLVLRYKNGEYCQDDPEAVKYEAKLPESFLPQLRTIEVNWNQNWINDDSIFTVVEILLKYATKLEQLVFRVKGILPPDSLLLASKKLLNMPRSSTNCTIDLLHK